MTIPIGLENNTLNRRQLLEHILVTLESIRTDLEDAYGASEFTEHDYKQTKKSINKIIRDVEEMLSDYEVKSLRTFNHDRS